MQFLGYAEPWLVWHTQARRLLSGCKKAAEQEQELWLEPQLEPGLRSGVYQWLTTLPNLSMRTLAVLTWDPMHRLVLGPPFELGMATLLEPELNLKLGVEQVLKQEFAI